MPYTTMGPAKYRRGPYVIYLKLEWPQWRHLANSILVPLQEKRHKILNFFKRKMSKLEKFRKLLGKSNRNNQIMPDMIWCFVVCWLLHITLLTHHQGGIGRYTDRGDQGFKKNSTPKNTWQSTKNTDNVNKPKRYSVCKVRPLKIPDSNGLNMSLTWNVDEDLNILF